jgi:telomerase reverse transcriptase
LLASFFHITHISSSNELFFFHHKTWDRISEPFIQKYLETYLVERDILSDIALNADFTDSIKSRFKVMPKKANDFRVINTPLRGLTPSKDFEYMNKVNNEIRPAKRILNQLRLSQTSKFRKITSMSQISRFIGQFKEVLNENYSQIPELYFVKFDVKACYDSIPADKVSKILHELVEKEEVYYSGTRSDVDLVSATSKTCRTLSKSDNVDGLFQNFQPHTRPLIVGKTHVHSMLGDEILNIAKSQLEHTLTKIRGRYYSRKIGVFQGLHHSSLFCDILYDRLIDDKFHFLAETESIILRVADDFLVVSTDASLTSRSKKLLENGMIADYGITINELKTVVNFSSLGDYEDSVGSIKFCGFKIDTCNLDLIKEFDNNNNNNSMISAVACRSHKKLVDRLLRMYKIRISYNTLSMRVNSFDSILKQLSIIVETVAISYCVCSKRVILTLKGLESFIRSLIKESAKVMKFDYVEKSQQLQAEIRIIETFLKVLKTKNTRFAAFISYLQQQIYIRQDH